MILLSNASKDGVGAPQVLRGKDDYDRLAADPYVSLPHSTLLSLHYTANTITSYLRRIVCCTISLLSITVKPRCPECFGIHT